MNTSDSQKTPSSICILLGIGISAFITTVELLHCKHESMPCAFWLQKKGTVLIYIYKLGKWRKRHSVTGKVHTAPRGQVGWLVHGHIRALMF